MRSSTWSRIWVWGAWIASLLAGCESFFAPRGIPYDPLLYNRQPIESKGQVLPAPVLVHHEPVPPGARSLRPR